MISVRNLSFLSSLGVLFVLGFQPARAELISVQLPGNDCPGYFELERGFSSCYIWAEDAEGVVRLSPVIAKFGDEDEVAEFFSGSVSGDEWTIELGAGGGRSGSWTYDPGTDDPAVRYWSVKYGNQFSLFFDVDDATLCDNPLSLSCLSAANAVTSGSWSNLSKGFSHIVFYDGGSVSVPLPGALSLMAAGLVVVGWGARRRRQP